MAKDGVPNRAVGRLRDLARRTKRVIRAVRGEDLWEAADCHREVLCLGNDGADWYVCPENIDRCSIVYSFGVGTDISFDLELIRRFQVHVHAFDPTPKAIEWMGQQDLPRQFAFHPYGIAPFDGKWSFSPPLNRNHVSHSILQRGASSPRVELPVACLRTIMKSLGHEQIDILKMDIEGAEYDVLENVLNSGIYAAQLLVEFHHRWREIGIEKTRRAIRSLRTSGYRIFHISASGEEYSFVHVHALEGNL